MSLVWPIHPTIRHSRSVPDGPTGWRVYLSHNRLWSGDTTFGSAWWPSATTQCANKAIHSWLNTQANANVCLRIYFHFSEQRQTLFSSDLCGRSPQCIFAYHTDPPVSVNGDNYLEVKGTNRVGVRCIPLRMTSRIQTNRRLSLAINRTWAGLFHDVCRSGFHPDTQACETIKNGLGLLARAILSLLATKWRWLQ